jgi:hypothetical protein
VFPIRRPPISAIQILIRAIAAANRTQCGPDQSLAGCITNIFLRPHERDLVFCGPQGYKPPKKAIVPRRPALLLLMPDPVNAWT